MSLAQECMQIYDKQNLHDLGQLEQDMATGLTETGDKIKLTNIKNDLVTFCQNPDIGVVEKLRLLMIYIISQGPMQDSTRKELMSGISLRLQKAIRNLEKLGVDISVLSQNKSKHSKQRLAEFEKRNKTIPLALMRYVPFIHSILNNLVTGQLSEEEFPYLGDKPSASFSSSQTRQSTSAPKKQTRSNWRNKKEKEKEAKQEEAVVEDNRNRYICYILGGVTFSELRSTYEIAESTNSNLFIGSTSTINSKDFIRGLADLDDAEDLDAANSDDQPKKKKETTPNEEKKESGTAKRKESTKANDKAPEKGKPPANKTKSKPKDDSDSDDDEYDRRKANEDFNKISIKFT